MYPQLGSPKAKDHQDSCVCVCEGGGGGGSFIMLSNQASDTFCSGELEELTKPRTQRNLVSPPAHITQLFKCNSCFRPVPAPSQQPYPHPFALDGLTDPQSDYQIFYEVGYVLIFNNLNAAD